MASDNTRNPSELNLVLTLDGNKIPESAFHRGNFLEPGKPQMQNVTSLDGITSMQVPSNWFKIEHNSQRADTTTFRPSATDKTQISFYGSRSSLDEKSAEAFKQVTNKDLLTPRIIYSEAMQADSQAHIQTIQDLSAAFGSTLVGDNQLTASGSRRPAFHIETAKIETVNGKNVVAVDGWFTQTDDQANTKMDENGPVKRRYSGVFFEVDKPGCVAPKVKELYLLADDNISFTSNKAAFKTALKSIKWQ